MIKSVLLLTGLMMAIIPGINIGQRYFYYCSFKPEVALIDSDFEIFLTYYPDMDLKEIGEIDKYKKDMDHRDSIYEMFCKKYLGMISTQTKVGFIDIDEGYHCELPNGNLILGTRLVCGDTVEHDTLYCMLSLLRNPVKN